MLGLTDVLLLASSSGLLVLIWLVQLVIYPAFAVIAADRFVDWHRAYTYAVSFVVIPLMFGQVVSLGMLLWHTPADPWLLATGLAVVVAWLLTFLWAVPCHGRLERGFDPAVHRSLLRANALRCLAWSASFVSVWSRMLVDTAAA